MPYQPTSRIFFTTYRRAFGVSGQCLSSTCFPFLSLIWNLLQTFLGTPSQAFPFNSSSLGYCGSRSGPLPALPHSTIPMCFPSSTSVQQPGCGSQQHHSPTEDRSPASPLAQRTHTTPLTPPSVVPATQCLCGFFEAKNPFSPQHLDLPLLTVWPVPSLSFPQSFVFQHW